MLNSLFTEISLVEDKKDNEKEETNGLRDDHKKDFSSIDIFDNITRKGNNKNELSNLTEKTMSKKGKEEEDVEIRLNSKNSSYNTIHPKEVDKNIENKNTNISINKTGIKNKINISSKKDSIISVHMNEIFPERNSKSIQNKEIMEYNKVTNAKN
mgnify:CR=1 FL=1